MKKVQLGIDILKRNKLPILKGKRVGLLANHASLDGKLNYTKDIAHKLYGKSFRAIFSPQHGFFGIEQDNMKESANSVDERLKVPVYSLYSDVKEPTDAMFDEIDTLIIDIFDVGTRVYTFIYSMALCMMKAVLMGKKVVVLDRPNPIGAAVEGNLIDDEFASFVGMYPIPMRHGLTVGELASLFNDHFGIGCDLSIVKMAGYDRGSYYDDTGLEFVMPSPNMPTLNTAIVYPGQVIFEGTNISEGRGTTRPFELFGAPYIFPGEIKASLEEYDIKGVTFNETYFKPTFNKYEGEVCAGLFLHITDRKKYRPYITSLIILHELLNLYPDKVKFVKPPYEYEYKKTPFDIITGDYKIRECLYKKDGIERIKQIFKESENSFKRIAKKYRLY